MSEGTKKAVGKVTDAVSDGAKKAKDAMVGGFKKVKDAVVGASDADEAVAKLESIVGKAGKVESVDGEKVHFAFDSGHVDLDLSKAKVRVNGEAATIADLRAGDEVKIELVDGELVVTATR